MRETELPPLPDPEQMGLEQIARLLPALLKFLLSGPDAYSDGVDDLLDWEIEGDIATGQFVDRRPAGDRIFGFRLDLKENSVDFWPISGVED